MTTCSKINNQAVRAALAARDSWRYDCDYLEWLRDRTDDPALLKEIEWRWTSAYHREEGENI